MAVVNIIYSIIEIAILKYGNKITEMPEYSTASAVIGGVFTGIFAMDTIVRIGRARKHGWRKVWAKKTNLEKTFTTIVTLSSVFAVGLYVAGVCLELHGQELLIFIMSGWTLNAVAHSLSMVTGFMASKRTNKTTS
jgi:hypothetical protein